MLDSGVGFDRWCWTVVGGGLGGFDGFDRSQDFGGN